MSIKTLYLIYSALIASLGLLGFLLTHAKSALISGLASGALMAILALGVEKNKGVAKITKFINLLLLAVFSWRAYIATHAWLWHSQSSKMLPALLLILMALVSFWALFASMKQCSGSNQCKH